MSAETIVRANHGKAKAFFIMTRDAAQNNDLSWEARGVLSYLLSRPDNWVIKIDDLRRGKCGRDRIRRIIDELIQFGYLEPRRRFKNKKGQWEYTPYKLHETPLVHPFTGNPFTGNPSTDFQSILDNTEGQNTEYKIESSINQPVSKESNSSNSLPPDFSPIGESGVVEKSPDDLALKRLIQVYEQTANRTIPEASRIKLVSWVKIYPEDRIANAIRQSKTTGKPVSVILDETDTESVQSKTSVSNTGSNIQIEPPTAKKSTGEKAKITPVAIEGSLKTKKTRKTPVKADKDDMPVYDHAALVIAIQKTFNVSGGVDLRILTLLRGTAKKGEWKDMRLAPERVMDADQLEKWAVWYKLTYPNQSIPQRAESISKYVNRWFDAGCPSSGVVGSHQQIGHQPNKTYHPDDPVYQITNPELLAIYAQIDWSKAP